MPNAPRPTAETVGPLLPKVLEFTVVLLSGAPDLSSGWIQPRCRNCDPAHPGRDAPASRPRAPAPATPRTCESGPGSPPRAILCRGGEVMAGSVAGGALKPRK